MKWLLVSDNLSQSVRSAERSISSAVQKEASLIFVHPPATRGRAESLLGFSCGVGNVGTEFVPVIGLVANEVGDLAERLVCDCMFEGHGLV